MRTGFEALSLRAVDRCEVTLSLLMFAIPTVEIRRLHVRTNSDGGGSKHDKDQMTMSRRKDGSRAVWKLSKANGKLRFKSYLQWAYWRHPVIQADLRQY